MYSTIRFSCDGVYSFLLRINRPALFGLSFKPLYLYAACYYIGFTSFFFCSTKIDIFNLISKFILIKIFPPRRPEIYSLKKDLCWHFQGSVAYFAEVRYKKTTQYQGGFNELNRKFTF